MLSAVGAGAVNQAVKATAIARRFFGPTGQDMAIIPGFKQVVIEGQDKTAITLAIIIL